MDAQLPDDFYTAESHSHRADDGTVTTDLYKQPAFKQDASDNWSAIDSTVSSSSASDTAATAPGLTVPTSFGRSAENVVSFDANGSTVTVSAPDLAITATPTVTDTGVNYPAVAPGVDLSYEVGPGQVKEALTIASADAQRSYTFLLSDPDGRLGQAVPSGTGGWNFTGSGDPADNAVVLSLPRPIAYEAATGPAAGSTDATGPPNAIMDVTPVDGGFSITVTLSDDWAAQHSFPIVLDPTYVWAYDGRDMGTEGLGPSQEGWSYVNPTCTTPDSTHCVALTDNGFLGAGIAAASNVKQFRSFMQWAYGINAATYGFDGGPTHVPFNLPLRAHIDWAGLWLRFAGCYGNTTPAQGQNCPATTGSSPTNIQLHEMTGGWSSSSKWADLNSAMSSTAEPVPSPAPDGNDANSSKQISYYPLNPTYYFVNYDANYFDKFAWQRLWATNIVQDWVNNPDASHGLAITSATETGTTGAAGSTWFSAGYSDVRYWPVLQLQWHPDAPGKVSNITTALNGTTLTTTWNQPTTGTYSRGYQAFLVDAATGAWVQTSPVITSVKNNGQNPATETVSYPFTNVLPGRYFLFVNASNEAGTSTTASAPFNVGAGVDLSTPDGMGKEAWWTFENTPVGPNAAASVNVGNGNLVVQDLDSTAIAGHGQLGYVLRRTYNSQAPLSVGLVSSGIAQGWTFNVSQAGDLGVPLAAGIQVPPDLTSLTQSDLYLVDRDGTRHKFKLNSTTTSVQVGVGSATSFSLSADGLLGLLNNPTSGVNMLTTLANNAVAVDGIGGLATVPNLLRNSQVCVDTTYSSPHGVQMSLWRFVAIGPVGANDCGHISAAAGPNGLTQPVLLGYGSMTPDRLQQLFSVTGQLVSQFDSRGNELRYVYQFNGAAGTALGSLRAIYEPASCTDTPNPDVLFADPFPAGSTCRHTWIQYLPNQVTVTDPAGRQTIYTVTGAFGLGQLTGVTTKDAAGGTLETWGYTYETTGAICGGNAGQLCKITDPRGNITSFTYSAGRIATVGRRYSGADPNTPTATSLTSAFTYAGSITDPAGATTTVTQAGRGRRYAGIDSRLRVAESDTSTAANVATGPYVSKTAYTWDSPNETGTSCRVDGKPDNDLCAVTHYAGTVNPPAGTAPSGWTQAPDQAATYTYTDLGKVLTEAHGLGAAQLTTRYQYSSAYWTPGSTTPTTVTDPLVGSRVGTPPANTEFAVSDLTANKDANGNTTAFAVDANYAARPGTLTATCGSSSTGGNTGLLCAQTTADSATTAYTYDPTFGQRATMLSPTGGLYTYAYYTDRTPTTGDLDLTGLVNAGGWLKAVTDPANQSVALGYDRAGNVVRAWDRDATNKFQVAHPTWTAAQVIQQFPGTTAAPPLDPTVTTNPPPLPYVEDRYATGASLTAFTNPWRYVRTHLDQLGDTTTTTVDANGNPTVVRPPRGNAAGTATYDITTLYDARDEQTSVSVPASPGQATTFTYDEAGNRTVTTDPNGHQQVTVYDPANRATQNSIGRGGALAASPGCTAATSSDAPFAAGYVICRSTVGYDGLSNVYNSFDATGGATWTTFDGVGRGTDQYTLRSVDAQGVNPVWIHTATAYDNNGNTVVSCPARQFEATPTATCGQGALAPGGSQTYSTYTTIDSRNRPTAVTNYRQSVDASGQLSSALNTAITISTAYDAAGNTRTVTTPDTAAAGLGGTITNTYNLLDRLTRAVTLRTSTSSTTTDRAYDPSGNLTSTSTYPSSTPSDIAYTDYTYDVANRLVDTILGATSNVAANVGVPSNPFTATVNNTRTRRLYDRDGHIVATYDPRAFFNSVTAPDAEFLTRVDYDASGRPINQWQPYYNTASGSSFAPFATDVEGIDCPTPTATHQPTTISGVPAYPSTVGLCVTRVTYDAAGNLVTQRNPTGSVITAASNPNFTNPNRFQQFNYTDDNLLAEAQAPNPFSNADVDVPATHGLPAGRIRVADYTYDGQGRQVTAIDPNADPNSVYGFETDSHYTLDGLNDTVQAKSTQSGAAVQRAVASSYDASGSPTDQSVAVDSNSANNQVTHTQYYGDGSIYQKTAGYGSTDASTTRYGYDADGNPTTIWSPSAVATSSANNTNHVPTTNAFTFDNLLATTTEPVSPDGTTVKRQTAYGYDKLGNKTSQAVLDVNSAGNPVDPNGTSHPGLAPSVQSFVYNDNGTVRSQTGRNGETISNYYYANAQLFVAVDSASSAATWATYYLNGWSRSGYDSVAALPARVSEFRYYGDGAEYTRGLYNTDTNGNATTIDSLDAAYYTDARLPSSLYHYQGVTNSWNTWTVGYDRDGRPVGTTSPDNTKTVSGTTYTKVNNTAKTWAIDSTLTAQTLYDPQSNTEASFSYGYDKLGRPTSQTETGTSPSYATYQYDHQGRVNTWGIGTDAQHVNTNTVTYDANSNRTQVQNTAGTSSTTYRADNSICTTTTTCPATGNDATTATYNAAGDQLATSTSTNTYDGFDRLTCKGPATSCTGSQATTYTYDAIDRQTTRTTNAAATSILYVGLSTTPVLETNPSDATKTQRYATDVAGDTLATYDGAATPQAEFLHSDGQHNIAVSNASDSNALCAVHYDPWGTPITTSGTAISGTNVCATGTSDNNIWYREGRRDTNTGNYQNGSRTYQPTTGTWLSPDSYRADGAGKDLSIGADPLTANRYSYLNGDPINLVDPNGHSGHWSTDPDCQSNSACKANDSQRRTAWQARQEVLDNQQSVLNSIDADFKANGYTPPDFYNNYDFAGKVDYYYRSQLGAVGWDLPDGWQNWDLKAKSEWFTKNGDDVGCKRARSDFVCQHQDGLLQIAGIALTISTVVAGGASLAAIPGAIAKTTVKAVVINAVKGAVVASAIDATVQKVVTGNIDLTQVAQAGALGAIIGAGRVSSVAAAAESEGGVASELAGACHSFAPATLVVLADGTRKAISDVAVGDRVRTTDPATGRTVVRTVTTLHRNHDTDLADLVVRDGNGHESTVHTTQHHRFWDETRHDWADAADLAVGDLLHTDDGTALAVAAVRSFPGLEWMYDLTVDDVHTYYVVAGTDPVLVHNCPVGGEGPSYFRGAPQGEEPSFQLKPNEYRMTGTGQVRGLSVFDNPEAITGRGMSPFEVDQASVPDALSVEQRGGNLDHFEIVPAGGAFPPMEEFQALLNQVSVL